MSLGLLTPFTPDSVCEEQGFLLLSGCTDGTDTEASAEMFLPGPYAQVQLVADAPPALDKTRPSPNGISVPVFSTPERRFASPATRSVGGDSALAAQLRELGLLAAPGAAPAGKSPKGVPQSIAALIGGAFKLYEPAAPDARWDRSTPAAVHHETFGPGEREARMERIEEARRTLLELVKEELKNLPPGKRTPDAMAALVQQVKVAIRVLEREFGGHFGGYTEASIDYGLLRATEEEAAFRRRFDLAGELSAKLRVNKTADGPDVEELQAEQRKIQPHAENVVNSAVQFGGAYDGLQGGFGTADVGRAESAARIGVLTPSDLADIRAKVRELRVLSVETPADRMTAVEIERIALNDFYRQRVIDYANENRDVPQVAAFLAAKENASLMTASCTAPLWRRAQIRNASSCSQRRCSIRNETSVCFGEN